MSASLRTGLIAVLFILCNALVAQVNVTDELQRGDKQFDLYAYTIASQTFESVLKTDPNNAYAMARIGDCHMQLNRVDDAIAWYAKAVAQPGVEPDVYAKYGKALMQKGDYGNAQTWFEKWKTTDAANAQRYLEMCAYASQTISMEPLYQVKSETINSPSADFGPAFFGNRLVYSSSRTDIPRKSSSKSSQDWSGSAYNQLFITQVNPETQTLQTPAYFQNDLSNQFNEGPVSFSGDGKRVAFCRNNFIDGTRQLADKGINLSLYLADMSGDTWKDPKAYPFNGTDYSTGYPSLSVDGNTLYFASNRPGGQGGWDIYVSRYNNGQWSMPVNLGPPLNTPGNEISPFFDEKDLFFASDWHRGYGGLDVFKGVLEGDHAVDVKHLGPGINSSRDDYSFAYHTSGKIGYVTSNRAGGRGAEDLYAITRKDDTLVVAVSSAPVDITTPAAAVPDMYQVAAAPADFNAVAVAPADFNAVAATPATKATYYLLATDVNGAPLEGVRIDARQCIGETGVTDAEGKYYFPTDTVVLPCAVLLRISGYSDLLLDVPAFGRTNMTATLVADQRKEMRGVVLDESTKKPLADAYISLTVPETGAEMQAQTNAKGEYVLFITPGKTYNAQVVKTGYIPKQASVTPKDSSSLRPVYLVSSAKQSAKSVAASAPATPTAVPAGATSAAGGYSIQVGAFPQKPTSAQYKEYEPLTPFGHVYNVHEDNMYKVRLGVYSSKNKANTVLKEVRAMPKFKSAYVVEERNIDNSLLLDEVNKPMPSGSGQTASGPALHAVEIANQELTKPVFLERYANISNLGNLYNKPENNRMSIRLGVWSDPASAENARQEVIKRGYPNALPVTEDGADLTYQSMLITTGASPQAATAAPTGITQSKPQPAQTAKTVPATDPAKPFFVRLAALSKPESFKPSMLNGVSGTLEKKLLSNGMTLFYLSGFSTKAEAQTSVDKARANGFTEAFVAELRDGQLVRHND